MFAPHLLVRKPYLIFHQLFVSHLTTLDTYMIVNNSQCACHLISSLGARELSKQKCWIGVTGTTKRLEAIIIFHQILTSTNVIFIDRTKGPRMGQLRPGNREDSNTISKIYTPSYFCSKKYNLIQNQIQLQSEQIQDFTLLHPCLIWCSMSFIPEHTPQTIQFLASKSITAKKITKR